MTWLQGDAVTASARRGRVITDDRPRPEYFLLRRLFGRKLLTQPSPTRHRRDRRSGPLLRQ
jgi:hypothetical protein